ncbi:hypothetical protein ACLOJK_010568 [Asimina triloba]
MKARRSQAAEERKKKKKSSSLRFRCFFLLHSILAAGDTKTSPRHKISLPISPFSVEKEKVSRTGQLLSGYFFSAWFFVLSILYLE